MKEIYMPSMLEGFGRSTRISPDKNSIHINRLDGKSSIGFINHKKEKCFVLFSKNKRVYYKAIKEKGVFEGYDSIYDLITSLRDNFETLGYGEWYFETVKELNDWLDIEVV